MSEKFSERARQAIFLALERAKEDGSTFVLPRHLLYGVVEADPEILGVFSRAADCISRMSRRATEWVGKGAANPARREILMSNTTRRVLKSADSESRRLGDERIETGHLMVGLLRTECVEDARQDLDESRATHHEAY